MVWVQQLDFKANACDLLTKVPNMLGDLLTISMVSCEPCCRHLLQHRLRLVVGVYMMVTHATTRLRR